MFETPSQEVFDEMREIAIGIWNTYNDEHWYASEKIAKINSINNVEDNAMTFYRMFDSPNQMRFNISIKSEETLKYIKNNQ